ncbi:MAG: VanZ family protein [Deltaproteobacteria bacterium]|nr:VanZ family protein [Deltaproteobacteria bacterium]
MNLGKLATSLRLAPALGWSATIWWSSSRTWPEARPLLADLPHWLLAVLTVVPPDKLVHTAIYALLGALWRVGLRGHRAGVQAWALATAFGGLDELHQGWVPGRSSDPWDLLADATGAALAVACWTLLAKRAKPPAP